MGGALVHHAGGNWITVRLLGQSLGMPSPSRRNPSSSHLVQEVDALGEQEVGVDEDHLDLVEESGLGDGGQDDAVTGDEGRGEERVLLVLPRCVRCMVGQRNASRRGGGWG